MVWIGLVTAAALLEYMVLGVLVGRARIKVGIAAPATTGNPIFERYYRVHQNTLEALIVFIPCLWLFAVYVNRWPATSLGVIFIAGRVIYAVGYVKDPVGRAPGAIITMAVNAILVVGSLIGLIVYAA